MRRDPAVAPSSQAGANVGSVAMSGHCVGDRSRASLSVPKSKGFSCEVSERFQSLLT